MSSHRVDLRRRSRVISDRYCPRCWTPTDFLGMSPLLRVLCRFTGVRASSRACTWCGWQGVRVH